MSDTSNDQKTYNLMPFNRKYNRSRDSVNSAVINEPIKSTENLNFYLNHSGYKKYLRVLKSRQRDIFTYSILIIFLFCSPIAPAAIYYGIKANQQINRGKNLKLANKYLDRANFINLTSLIISALVLICIILLGSIYFFSTFSSLSNQLDSSNKVFKFTCF
jgi:hypothetical protein